MSSAGRQRAPSARRWRFASGFCAVLTFTVIVGYYVPLQREARHLRSEREKLETDRGALRAELEEARLSLSQSHAQREQLTSDSDSQKSGHADMKVRIEKLKEVLSAEFGRLTQAKMLSLSSAGDRVSVAIAVPVLFAPSQPGVTKNGRVLLCQMAKSIMAAYAGQIRVTGYYGKRRIEEPELLRRYATPWELSAARAARAVDVLESDCGAPTDRFLVVGYGPRAAGPLGENVAFELIFKAGD